MELPITNQSSRLKFITQLATGIASTATLAACAGGRSNLLPQADLQTHESSFTTTYGNMSFTTSGAGLSLTTDMKLRTVTFIGYGLHETVAIPKTLQAAGTLGTLGMIRYTETAKNVYTVQAGTSTSTIDGSNAGGIDILDGGIRHTLSLPHASGRHVEDAFGCVVGLLGLSIATIGLIGAATAVVAATDGIAGPAVYLGFAHLGIGVGLVDSLVNCLGHGGKG